MADIESLNHSGISIPDTRAGAEFYEKLFGAQIVNFIGGNSDEARRGRGVPHPMILIGDYALVGLVGRRPVVEGDSGPDAARQAFAVPKARFTEIVDLARACEIAFEGPAAHPENGPLGESIYLEDPGGNRLEICWRRDEGRSYEPHLSFPAAPADSPATVDGLHLDRLGGVTVEAGDLAATRAFYERIFDGTPGAWAESGGGLRFEARDQTIDFIQSAQPRNRAHAGEHQAYRVGAARVRPLADELATVRHSVSWWTEDHPTERSATAYVEDPSGNRVQLVAADPSERLLDHVGVPVHELEDADAYWVEMLGGTVDYYHGWSTADVLEARAASEHDATAAPWTRRATMSFRTHQPEPLPTARLFLSYGRAKVNIILTLERIPELPEEIIRGTPRVVLRTQQATTDVVAYLSEATFSPVFMKRPRRVAFERDGDNVYLRDPSGNFLQLRCEG